MQKRREHFVNGLAPIVFQITLHVEAQRRAFRAGAGEATDDARAVVKQDAYALMLAPAAVNRICVAEIICVCDVAARDRLSF
jgi:hypothetical protein